MAEKEVWTHFDETGKGRKFTVENPDDYFKGWDMFFETKSIGENNYFPAVLMYWQLLGYYWKDMAGRVVTATQKAILGNKNVALLIMDFYSLVESAGYQNILNEYQKGNIPPELGTILNYQPMTNTEVFNAILDQGGFNEVVLNAVKDGKIDFTPFNDTDDNAPDWFLKYRLSPVPIPGYMGKLENMGKLTQTTEKETRIERHKKEIKQQTKEHIINALQDGISPETLYLLADEIKERYQAYKNAGKRANYNPALLGSHAYTSPRTAGFVVDITAGKVFDLRPHFQTMWELLTPGIEPLKEFYYAVRRYTTDALKKEKQGKERTPEALFENTPFLMMRNSRESNAIASVSGSMLQIAVQQELALTDEKGNQLYNYTANAPMKSGEVIISVKETPKGGALRPSTEKLHILFDTLFTKSGYTEFVFPIDAYMELCKRTPGEITPENRRKFKQKLRQDLQRMKNTKFSANLPGCKPGEIGILNAWLPAPNNCMYIKLERLYCESLTQRNAGKMQIPTTIFKTNEQNPHLIPIMRILCRNRTDYHNVNMEAKGGRRAHTISLKTLYEYDLALPRWEKVSKSGRHYDRDIIKPLFNAIRELNDENYIKSKYIDRDGIEHTEAEMKTAGIVDILDPEKWLLDYEIVGFKDDPEMIKSAMERAKQRDDKRIQDAVKKITKAKKKKQ